MKHGGFAEAAEVDALSEKQIDEHIKAVVRKAGTIDISFNVIGMKAKLDMPLIKMNMKDFTRPVMIAMESHFYT